MRKFAAILLFALLGAELFILAGSVIGSTVNSQASCEDLPSVYTVQAGDKLFEIGMHYGDFRFWEAIYIANADLIDDPDVIYPGQQFEIPNSIYSFSDSDKPLEEILSNPFCADRTVQVSAVDWSRLALYTLEDIKTASNSKNSDLADKEVTSTDNSKTLADFRDAFNAVVKSPDEPTNSGAESDSLDADRRRDAVQQQSERQIMMEIDGMVLDETRSKVGRDFYDVFYSSWQSPENASNFSIRIAEQPSPSLGTIIYVEVNDTETFRMRLQPRYDFIQQAGRYAVSQTYSYLQNNDHRLQIY